MVGVPGRSKACHTCRQRRIKCGGELPTCGNCAKSKRICAGYQRNHAFILSRDMVNSTQDDSAVAHRVDNAESGKVMLYRWRLDEAQQTSSKASSIRFRSPTQPIQDSFPLLLQVNPRNVFRDKLFSFFASKQISVDNYGGLGFGDRNNRWMVPVVSLPHFTPALEDALLALFTARLGRHSNQPVLVHEGLRLYTSGMSRMRDGIAHVLKATDDQSLAACLALLLYEVTECPSGNLDGYKAHCYGALHILQLGGADGVGTDLARILLETLRVPSAFFSLLEGKKSILAKAEWRDLPWGSNPESKELFDRLIDIYLDMAELSTHRCLLEAMTNPHPMLKGALETLRDGERIELALDAWSEELRATVPGSLYHAELSTAESATDNLELGKLFPVAFHFPAPVVGQNLVFYWAALVHVRSHICLVQAFLSRLVAMLESADRDCLPCSCNAGRKASTECLRHVTPELLSQGRRRRDEDCWPFEAAKNVCQSVEYFLKNEELSVRLVMPALMIVRNFWGIDATDRWELEKTWIAETLARMRSRGTGIEIALG